MSASVWQPGGSSIAVNAENASLVQKFIASAGQTVFALTQFSYVLATGSIRVYRNGVKLAASEVTELTTTTFSVPALVLETGEVIECSAVLGSQDAVTAAAINAAASAAASAASAAAASGVVASVDFTKTSVSTFSNKTLDSSCNLSTASGQLAGFRNVLINGEVTRVNQRGVANWASVTTGQYGFDRWKKIDASNITQIVEAGNFIPSVTYTLSGIGVTTQQLTSPASGNWTLPNIPIAATYVQLEKGSIATPFETRPIGLELALCQRYLPSLIGTGTGYQFVGQCYTTQIAHLFVPFSVTPRIAPTGIVVAIPTNCAVWSSTSVPIGSTAVAFANATLVGAALDVSIGTPSLGVGNATIASFGNAGIYFTGCEL